MSLQAQVNPAPEKKRCISVEEEPTGVRAAVYSVLGLLLQVSIEWLVRLTGKRIRKSEAPWLDCVLGKPGVIGAGVYQRIAEEEKLAISQPSNAGLIPSFENLRGPSFDPERVDPRIRHFYEHTALYKLEVWSEVYFAGKFVLWLLVEFISRRMDQLNFPISSLEVAKGMTSEIVQLREPVSGRLAYTGWLRRFRATGKVIYAGLYSVSQTPGEANPCVKVTFPCYGSSSVYLRPCVYVDGTFGLVSTGAAFGRSGFYRVVESGAEHWRVRNFKTLHEIFHVYADEDGVLRTDHEITFVGHTILRLHYKMTLAKNTNADVAGDVHKSLQAV
ncbi:MAG TPA: hypothetical protein VNO13_03800 [Candidatus Udaeobacter sp.]|nr:hypothetical protein [Candidatus Udaeobacter sp.]